MLDMNEAVRIALDAFVGLTGEKDRVKLEEVEKGLESGEEVWRVTVSQPNSENFEFIRGRPARDYKVITVSQQTREVLSIKIHQR